MTPNFILTFPNDVTSSNVMEELTEITMAQLCRACNIQASIVMELIKEGVLEGVSIQPERDLAHWKFTGVHLHRAKVATRLQRDLGVNIAGAALALQLIDEIDYLRKTIDRFER